MKSKPELHLAKHPQHEWLRIVKKPITVWKKAVFIGSDGAYARIIVQLQLKPGTLVRISRNYSYVGLYGERIVYSGIRIFGKHRANQAKVIAFQSCRGRVIKLGREDRVVSLWAKSFRYRIGRIVRPHLRFVVSDFTCASGIHFYLRRSAAVNH